MAMSTLRTTTTGQTAIRSVASKHQWEKTLLTDLFTAYYCARKNKRNTSSQVRFERNLSDNLMCLYDDLLSGHYRVGRSICFVIKDPVYREVFAASFRDRIVHHLLCNWLMPVFERTFIYDSYSCRVGKGNSFGVSRLEHHIRSCSENYRHPCYVLKLDIESYFMSIDRKILYEIVRSRILSYASRNECSFNVPFVLRLLALIIFNDPLRGCYRKGSSLDWANLPKGKSLFYAAPGCGLPIGNLTSQMFSNVYLSVLDNYVKRTLKFKHYGRYVDDFYLVSTSKDELLFAIPKIRSFLLSELGIVLHPRKIRLCRAPQSILFLGKTVRPFRTSIHPRCSRRTKNRFFNLLVNEPDPYRILRTYKSIDTMIFTL